MKKKSHTSNLKPSTTHETANDGLIVGTLCDLLTVINGFEGLSEEGLASAARDLLYAFKNHIGTREDFQSNAQLRSLDFVFTTAGWDDQGLRWMSEDGDGAEDIFLVTFTDKSHQTWEIA